MVKTFSELFNDIFYTLGGSEYFDDVDRLVVYNRCVAEGVKNCKCTQLGSHGVSQMVVNKKLICRMRKGQAGHAGGARGG